MAVKRKETSSRPNPSRRSRPNFMSSILLVSLYFDRETREKRTASSLSKCRSVKIINDKDSTNKRLTESKNLNHLYRKRKRCKKRKLTWMIPDKTIKRYEKGTINSQDSETEPKGPGNTVGSGNWSQGTIR